MASHNRNKKFSYHFKNFGTQTKSENCYFQEILICEKKSNLVLRQFAAKVSLLSIWGMLVAKKNCVVRRHSEIDGKKHGFRYFSLIIKCWHYCYYYTRLLSLPSGSRILLHQGQCLSIKVNYFHIVWFDKKILWYFQIKQF